MLLNLFGLYINFTIFVWNCVVRFFCLHCPCGSLLHRTQRLLYCWAKTTTFLPRWTKWIPCLTHVMVVVDLMFDSYVGLQVSVPRLCANIPSARFTGLPLKRQPNVSLVFWSKCCRHRWTDRYPSCYLHCEPRNCFSWPNGRSGLGLSIVIF